LVGSAPTSLESLPWFCARRWGRGLFVAVVVQTTEVGDRPQIPVAERCVVAPPHQFPGDAMEATLALVAEENDGDKSSLSTPTR
jgi:hypothetical protein